MRAVLHCGDCLALMPTLDAESVDAIVTDPPYGLSFMGKDWDHGIPGVAFWREALRVAKPGAHLVAFGGTRTYHRLACAIEDAGWEIRDTLMWLYGSGFPKSLDVSKAMDRHASRQMRWFGPWLREERERRGITQKSLAVHFPSKTGGLTGCVANWELGFNLPTVEQFNALCRVLELPFEYIADFEREVVGRNERPAGWFTSGDGHDITVPRSNLAKQWSGWGTALKPAWEPIILARKPLAGTVAATVAQFGTGALNIAQCRIAGEPIRTVQGGVKVNGGNYGNPDGSGESRGGTVFENTAGRWPANVILGCSCKELEPLSRGSNSHPHRGDSVYGNCATPTISAAPATASRHAPDCAVALLDAQSGERKGFSGGGANGTGFRSEYVGGDKSTWRHPGPLYYGDTGGASRFYYVARGEKGVAATLEDTQRSDHTGNLGDDVRFRYCAKASRREREAGLEGMPRESIENIVGHVATPLVRKENGVVTGERQNAPRSNGHPTVKPLALMRWLCRLVTPPGGLILDPFAGSGSTGCAAVLEGFRFLGIEQDPDYAAIGEARLSHWERVARRYHRLLAYRAAHPVEVPALRPADPDQIALFTADAVA